MDATQCAGMFASLMRSMEAAKTIMVYKAQAATFVSRLNVFYAACNHHFESHPPSSTSSSSQKLSLDFISNISAALHGIETNLKMFIQLTESTFSLELWDWKEWEKYFVKNSVFIATMQSVKTYCTLLLIPIPYVHIWDPWRDQVDMELDWRDDLRSVSDTCGSTSPLSIFLMKHAPSRPKLRPISSDDIVTLFEIDTSYAELSDDDEGSNNEEENDDDYDDQVERQELRKAREEEARQLKAKEHRGNFTSSVHVSTLKQSPVLLKKLGASFCRGGHGPEGVGHALLCLAATVLDPGVSSPRLLRPLGVCLDGVGVTEDDEHNKLMSLSRLRELSNMKKLSLNSSSSSERSSQR